MWEQPRHALEVIARHISEQEIAELRASHGLTSRSSNSSVAAPSSSKFTYKNLDLAKLKGYPIEDQ